MGYIETTAFKKIEALKKRIRVIQGGSSASKTISILLFLIAMAQTDLEPTLTSIVAESIPHLKKGALRDFKNIMQAHYYWDENRWNATDSMYTFETGSQIEFFSTDNGDKMRGARRDRGFMNEANNNTFEAFEQMEIRTKEFFILDYNPINEFWAHTEVIPKRTDVDFIILTYKDNEALDQRIVEALEQRQNRTGWWQVYGLGMLGEVEGKIYKDWKIIDELPHEAKLERYGLDFGYTNDPTSIVAVYKYNGGIILDEIAYSKGLSNKMIVDILQANKVGLVIADSAEPKSIDEIKSYGIPITGTLKGKDSVNSGIQYVQNQQISVTKRSINIIREYRNYLWETDKDGKVLNVPEHQFSHCFAPQSLVYTTKGRIPIIDLIGKEGYLYTRNGGIKRFYDVKATRYSVDTRKILFNDGQILEVTPDHLLLKPDGMWIEAQLLCVGDIIQSDMYEKGIYLQQYKILSIQGFKVLQRLCWWAKKMASSICLGGRKWRNTKRLSHPSQGQGQRKQCDNKLGDGTKFNTHEQTLDSRNERVAQEMGRCNQAVIKQVAQIKRGQGVAQVEWTDNLCSKKTVAEKLFSLPYEIYYNSICKIRQILQSELQNESSQKKIERIERGFCPVTYNLEVEDTHCLLVDGVIAHNSMDAVRYGIAYNVNYKRPAREWAVSEKRNPAI